MIRRCMCLLLLVVLGLSAVTKAPAEQERRISVSACIAATDGMAAKLGGTLTWLSEPYPGGAVIWGCEELDWYLLAEGDTLVRLGGSVRYDAAEPAPVEEFLGMSFAALSTVLMAGGLSEEAAFDAMLPLVNDQGFVQGVMRTAESGESHWFMLDGFQGVILRQEAEQGLRLCLLLHTAPDRMPKVE